MNTNITLDIAAIVESTRDLIRAHGEQGFTLSLQGNMNKRDWSRGPLSCRNFAGEVAIDFESVDSETLRIDASQPNDVIVLGLPEGSKVELLDLHCDLMGKDEVMVCSRAYWYPAPKPLIESMENGVFKSSLEEMKRSAFVILENIEGHLLLRFKKRFWTRSL